MRTMTHEDLDRVEGGLTILDDEGPIDWRAPLEDNPVGSYLAGLWYIGI